MKFVKKVLLAFLVPALALAAAFFPIGGAAGAEELSYLTDSAEVKVYADYKLSGGGFDDMSSIAAAQLTPSDVREARADKGFSQGYPSDASYIEAEAVLYETVGAYGDAEGASITLLENYTGNFSTIAAPILYGGRMVSGVGKTMAQADFSKFTFVLRDNNDAWNALRITVEDTADGQSRLVLEYGGATSTWNGLYNGANCNFRASGSLMPIILLVDISAKKLFIERWVSTEYILTAAFPGFGGFEDYSVSLEFSGINTNDALDCIDGKGRVYIYELCGQSLNKNAADETAPYIIIEPITDLDDFYIKDTLSVPKAYGYDITDGALGALDAVVYYSATDLGGGYAAGDIIAGIAGGGFKPSAAGYYTFEYTAEDAALRQTVKTAVIHIAQIYNPDDLPDYVVPERFFLDVTAGKTILPFLIVSERWTYTIDLFASDDVKFIRPLAQRATDYAFTYLGDYLLRYNLMLDGNVANFITVTVPLSVGDFTAPEITVKGSYEKSYVIGDVLTIHGMTVTDNFDAPEDITVKIQLLFGNEQLDISSGTFTFKKAGDYRVIYSATDSMGNRAEIIFEFTVTAPSADRGCKGCGKAASALLPVFAFTFIWAGRKKYE